MIHFQMLFGATVFANLYFYTKYKNKNKRRPNTSFLLKAQREKCAESSKLIAEMGVSHTCSSHKQVSSPNHQVSVMSVVHIYIYIYI